MNSPFTKWLPTPDDTKHTETSPQATKQQTMVKQFSKHHGAKPRYLSVGDRVLVLTRKDKREKGVIHKVLSKTRYSVRLDDGKIIDRHINHIWRGGSTPSTPSQDPGDDWIFLQPPAPPTTLQEPQPISEPDSQLLSSPTAQTPANRNLESPAARTTPVRPTRNRMAPKRLILDPAAKNYSQG
ncbi:PREDICTED: uncharacterized protein LOC105570837 [Vollenhovia emeryi]|uniref:uncharacterized protein LOC105570837 n=1 Tax=Vollenhovia emeryi TaxID=411798 RepID=UPI0005F526C8|nr:PREDICTED: uncharacterized protein LOC105570837 [Vollenhovia emeryi]